MPQEYERAAKLEIDEVLPILIAHSGLGKKHKVKVEIAGHQVKVTGVRLQTFATKGCTCSRCGLKATHFAVERTANGNVEGFHLNLWGEKDGEKILFTHDHTIDRVAGGKDDLSNTTTMCSPCNQEKAIEHRNARVKWA